MRSAPGIGARVGEYLYRRGGRSADRNIEGGAFALPQKSRTFRTTLAVTLVIFASKALGFLRDVISAGYFATGMERDAYSSAYTLFYVPVLLFNSCITSTIVPLYIEAKNKSGIRAANHFASNCLNLFAAFALGAGVLMMLAAGPLVKLVFGGFAGVPGKLDLTADLLRVMLPSLLFVVGSIVLTSILNANEHYLAAQLTGFPLSVSLIVATVAFAPRYGIRATAWGVFAAGILQMLILLPSASSCLRYSPRMRLGDKRFRRMMILAVPAILSMAVNELNHIVDKSLASYLNPGDPSAMDYAYRLVQFVIGVLAVPITTIMFSRLSQQAAAGDKKGVVAILTQSTEVLTMILLPVTVIAAALSRDIITLAYMHGNFGKDAMLVTSGVFFFYIVGILGFGLRDVFNRAFHALQDTKTPMLGSVVTVALNIVLNVLLSRVMGVNGLALATSISCAVGALLLVFLLKKRMGARLRMGDTWRELVKIILSAAACLGAVLLIDFLLPQASGKGMAFLRLAAAAALSLTVYLGALMILRARQLAFLKGLFRRRRK